MRVRKFPRFVLGAAMLLLLAGCIYESDSAGSLSEPAEVNGSNQIVK